MTDDVIVTNPYDHNEFISHYGILRKSGRYPWGSGDDPYQRSLGLLDYIDAQRKAGKADKEIAKDLKISTTEMRVAVTIANNTRRAELSAQIGLMQDRGMSNVAIGKRLGMNESQVRNLASGKTKDRLANLRSTADALKAAIPEGGYLDIGTGTERHLGVSLEKMKSAIAVLKEEEGYQVFYYKTPQLGTGKFTNTRVLAPEDARFPDLIANPDKIATLNSYSEDGGRTFKAIKPPVSVDPDRVGVRYKEEGGATKDGVIELRRGVADLSLNGSQYAQVRIKVGDGHYLKGMAMYSDNIPDGVDMVFNTNKSNTGNKLDAMKETKIDKSTGKEDKDLPFGSIVRQIDYRDPKTGKPKQSPLNIVGTRKEDEDGVDISYSGEEGGWMKWGKTLSSQFLSKQRPALAQDQLEQAFLQKEREFNEINALTNEVVKQKLLQSFSDGVDAAAVHLKAVGLPRTRNHVILPINSLKDNEVYAPNYDHGETVVLVRHPHGGKFEIPSLKVNNKNKEAISVMGGALDAVGINSRVAERLSGADFDGDTVLVIPNNRGLVKTEKALQQLKGFDPQAAYPGYTGMKTMDGGIYDAETKKVTYGKKGPAKANKQRQMGDISNLITDMTVKGAPNDEIARAVKHSMVVIDAEKHKLDFRTSAIQNGIPALKNKYQNNGGTGRGASTLISRAKSDTRLDRERRPRSSKEGGGIDKETGKLMWEPTGRHYVNKAGDTIYKQGGKVKTILEIDDANELSSGELIERIYANHANKLKALGNRARKEMVAIKPPKANESAKRQYASEVSSLNAKLNVALKNAPIEREAQRLGNVLVKQKMDANPGMDKDEEKKLRSLALIEARERTGAKKEQIKITPREWEAIQAGAVSPSKLAQILNNADQDLVKEYATPRERVAMTAGAIAKANSMRNRGYTQAEIAEALGVSVSTLAEAFE